METEETEELSKCPECLCVTLQDELDTFGGVCEECYGDMQ